LSFADEGAFGVVLRPEVADDLRLDGGVDGAVESSDPLALDGNIALFDDGHLDFGGRGRRRGRVALGASDEVQGSGGGEQSHRDDGDPALAIG
jgi:hypothetical protein